ncbi:YrhB domain-containing protein [Sphingomonas floccifaciens]|uniref:YrhB domain-containing protein n=1 Tax=Sphingomonas floccifaciens TaxID=1844115 RepID=A0ABW4NEW5_9SPHN
MASHERYGSYQISWRENGEQFVALLRSTAEEDPPAIITTTVSEGMAALKSRTFAVIDAGVAEAYRPNLLAPNGASPVEAFDAFLSVKELEVGEPLSALPAEPSRLSAGWAFFYQSRAYVETGAFEKMLVGHGPVVITDDGRIIEGGSLDGDPEEMLRR